MRVRFLRAFDYRPSPRVVMVFKPGEHTVKRECGDAAIAEGAAEELSPPARDDAQPSED